MISLGVRVEPKKVHYAVYNSSTDEFVTVDHITMPQTLSLPDMLKYIRNNLIDLLEEYSISRAGIKIMENNVQKPNYNRLYIEGVLLEALASRQGIRYKTFVLSQIASAHDSCGSDIKKILEKQDNTVSIDSFNYDISSFKKEEIEAMLVATGVQK